MIANSLRCIFFFIQFGLVHYFTKIGAGEYYLEELEETVCEVEIRYCTAVMSSSTMPVSESPALSHQGSASSWSGRFAATWVSRRTRITIVAPTTTTTRRKMKTPSSTEM